MELLSKHLSKISIATGVFTIIFMFICIPLSSVEMSKISFNFRSQQIDDLSWHYVEKDEIVTLPIPVSGKGYESVTLEKMLPDDIPDNYSILLNSCNSIIYVYIDDIAIYEIGENGGTVFGKMLSDLKCLVPISKKYAGHKLTVVTTPVVDYSGKIPEIYFRNYSDQVLAIILDNMWCVVISTMLLVLCLYSLVLGITKKSSENSYIARGLICYSIFCLTILIYTFSNSDLPQLISGYNEINSLTTYLSLAFATVPLMAIYNELLPHCKNIFSIIQISGCLLTIINILLYVTHVFLPSQLLIFTQVLYFMLALILIYFCFTDSKSRSMKFLNFGSVCLFIIGLASLIIYYQYPDKDWNVIVLSSGVLLFSVFLIVEMLSFETTAMKDASIKDAIDSLAFIDSLTQIANSSALLKYATEIAEMPSSTRLVAVAMEIDNLATITEQLGDVAGDILLQKAAKCLSSAFNSCGTVYRYKENEFVALVLNPTESCIDYEDKLNNAILVNNRVTPYKLSIIIGSAIAEVGTAPDEFFSMLIEEAERNMQNNKAIY